MSIEKNRSIVLSALPYRESSLLVYLYSLQYGRINAIAKGIRRNDKRSVPLERGYLIEHMIYIKQHRDLHLITDCQIIDHYPGIRGNLEKTAVRDMVFDIIIAAIRVSDQNSPLFKTLIEFLSNLDTITVKSAGLLVYVSKVLFSVSEQLGFYIDFSHCATCGKPFDDATGASLNIQDGIIRCMRCSGTPSPSNRLMPSPLPGLLSQSDNMLTDALPGLNSLHNAMTLLSVAADYCTFHLDIHRKLYSQQFIEHLFNLPSRKNPIDFYVEKEYNCHQPENNKENTCQIHQ